MTNMSEGEKEAAAAVRQVALMPDAHKQDYIEMLLVGAVEYLRAMAGDDHTRELLDEAIESLSLPPVVVARRTQ